MLKRNTFSKHIAWISPTILAFLGGAASIRVFDLFRAGNLLSIDAMVLAVLVSFGLGLSIAVQVAVGPAE